MKMAGKWMKLENIMLSEVFHTKKDKTHVFSLIFVLWIQIFRYEHIIWNNSRYYGSKKGPWVGIGFPKELKRKDTGAMEENEKSAGGREGNMEGKQGKWDE